MRLILASGSPRRRQLLESIGLAFDVVAADVDETVLPGESPVPYVERVAALKAATVAADLGRPEAVAILAADTTVDLDGEILGKPGDDAEARLILKALSGRTHRVHTGIVGWTSAQVHTATVTTDVTFARLSEQGIDWYLSMDEHLDKAGAYGMQGAGGALVRRVHGSPSNVIGLPLAETIDIVRACGVRVVGG